MARPEISKLLAPILLIALALSIIGSDKEVAAESNLMGVYVDVTGDRVDHFEKRFDFSRVKGKGSNNARHKLRNKHKHTKSNYGAPKSQYEPGKPYRPSKAHNNAHNKPKGKYPPSQYSLRPVKSYVAPVYNSPVYNLPAYSPFALRPQPSRSQSERRPAPQRLVAHRPSTISHYKTSSSVRPNTSTPTRPKTSPLAHPKILPPTRPETLHSPSSHRPTHPTTSLSTITSTSTTKSTSVYSSPAPTSTASTTTTATSTTTTSSPLDISTSMYNSSITVSSTSITPDSRSPTPVSSQSKKKHVPSKKEIIPLKLKNEVQIKPAYTPKTSLKANTTSSVSVFNDKENEGFFSSPVEGFPNFFKQLLQG